MPSSSAAQPAQPQQPRAAGKFAIDAPTLYAEQTVEKQLAAALNNHRRQFNLHLKASHALEALIKHKESGTFPPTLAISIPKVTATWKDADLSKHEQTLKDMKVELLEEAIQQRTKAEATAQAALDTALATFAANCKVALCYDHVVVPLSPGERVAYDAVIKAASSLLSARLRQQMRELSTKQLAKEATLQAKKEAKEQARQAHDRASTGEQLRTIAREEVARQLKSAQQQSKLAQPPNKPKQQPKQKAKPKAKQGPPQPRPSQERPKKPGQQSVAPNTSSAQENDTRKARPRTRSSSRGPGNGPARRPNAKGASGGREKSGGAGGRAKPRC